MLKNAVCVMRCVDGAFIWRLFGAEPDSSFFFFSLGRFSNFAPLLSLFVVFTQKTEKLRLHRERRYQKRQLPLEWQHGARRARAPPPVARSNTKHTTSTDGASATRHWALTKPHHQLPRHQVEHREDDAAGDDGRQHERVLFLLFALLLRSEKKGAAHRRRTRTHNKQPQNKQNKIPWTFCGGSRSRGR